MIKLILAAKSDIGKIREENQDRFRIRQISDNAAILVVCDGMGGTHGGGVASEVAINAVFDRLILSYREDMEPRTVKNLLISSVTAANSMVYLKSCEEPKNQGMGTTCVAAIVSHGTVSIASVGDSRAYILDGSGIRQITHDHTVVEMLREKGMIDESELKTHRMKNVITRAVGVEETVEVDFFEISAEEGSMLLICTDGLSGYCENDMIYRLSYRAMPEQACTELINYANRQGGRDNITTAIALL